MGDDDIELLAFAEKDSNPLEWAELTYFEGNCLIGCEGRRLLKTRNLLAALRWADYHRSGKEHIKLLLGRKNGAGADQHQPALGSSAEA